MTQEENGNDLGKSILKLDKRLRDFQSLFEYYENSTKSFNPELSKLLRI